MLRLLALYALCCFFVAIKSSPIQAGADAETKPDTVVVRQITITGLHLTHRWVVGRELGFGVGDTVTSAQLEAARKRIENLEPLNHVEVRADSIGQVHIQANELWPLWPIISAEFTEGQLSDVVRKPKTFFQKVTVTLGASDFNFNGDATQVFALAQFGATRGANVGYATRWLAPRIPLAVSASFMNLRVLDRHAAVLDSTRHMRAVQSTLDVGTREGAPFRLGLSVSYEAIQQEKRWPAEGRHDRVTWLSPYAVLDHRDLEWYPTRGSYALAVMDNTVGTAPFVRSRYAAAGYFPFSSSERPPMLGLHFMGGTSTNSTPSWAHFYNGFDWGLRGYHSELSESATYLIGDVEFRFPITAETRYRVPLLGRYGQEWPFGILGVLYGQRAELQFNGRRLERWAGGGGLYVRVPYAHIIEAALSVNREGGLDYTISTGVSF